MNYILVWMCGYMSRMSNTVVWYTLYSSYNTSYVTYINNKYIIVYIYLFVQYCLLLINGSRLYTAQIYYNNPIMRQKLQKRR